MPLTVREPGPTKNQRPAGGKPAPAANAAPASDGVQIQPLANDNPAVTTPLDPAAKP